MFRQPPRYNRKPMLALHLIAALLLLQADPSTRLNQHKVTSRRSPAPEPGAENEVIPSLVEGLHTPADWYKKRRPEIEKRWLTILGKVAPAPEDRKWFGDIRRARVIKT